MASSAERIEQPAASSKPRARPVVGPRLRILLYIVFALVAVLTANAAYLLAVTAWEYFSGAVVQDQFYQYMFLVHLALGLILVVPLIVFGVGHMLAARQRRNRRAVKIGYALFIISIIVLVSGLLLMRVGAFDLKEPLARSVVYWLHIAAPALAAWLYWLHRLAGKKIKWKLGLAYLAAVGAVVGVMLVLQAQDPRAWYAEGPREGVKYFEPSLARTASGDFIPARALMNDKYCMECHQDIYDGWLHSAHRFSSFNNPAYLASVRETRSVAYERDGSVQAARWCAGCHDPVPFFSGAFDDPKYDDVNDPTAHAGITCTTCHAITHVNSTRGNADYTIEEPLHYPFAYSENDFLAALNRQMVKAKPEFHKKTFLKPFHKTAEFCSTCHKVHLPKYLHNYKDFLRGQNHYDSYLRSVVSGHGARSFYYPPKAQENCNGCHMPLVPSDDFGAKVFAGATERSIHNHLFPAANTGIAWLRDKPDIVEAHQAFLKDCARVDIFGIKEGDDVDGPLTAPLRPEVPQLEPGKNYVIETVIRTLTLGHLLTQGTVDSNELWLDVTVTSGGKVIGRSGDLDELGAVDPWSHFVNVFMLDRNGDRIDRRNAQDIFVPLYNHQIPPGAGQTVHYGLHVPEDINAPIEVEVKLQYRKFDQQYMNIVAHTAKPGDRPLRGKEEGEPYKNELPITTIAVDRIVFPVAGVDADVENEPSKIPPWQRWNDYGIGLLLNDGGSGRGELKQATEAFAEVEKLGRYDGALNQARVLFAEGLLDEAVAALQRVSNFTDPPAPPWTVAWLSGAVNRQQGHLEEAEEQFRQVLSPPTDEMANRGFDFRLDHVVINLLGMTLFDQAKQKFDDAQREQRDALLTDAAAPFGRTLEIDSEDVTAHHNLAQIYEQLGEADRAAEHRQLHERYKPDDNARDRAIAAARKKYPAANYAAKVIVIYQLQRDDDQVEDVTVEDVEGAVENAASAILSQ